MNIGIVGSGNLASHLSRAFTDAGIQLLFISSRNPTTGKKLASARRCLFMENPPAASGKNDILFVCTNDDSIPQVFGQLEHLNYHLVHCSGKIELQKTKKGNPASGVFYPVQTFAGAGKPDWKSIPICIESKSASLMQRLNTLASKLGGPVYHISSKKRALVHLSAVFVNNFTNAQFSIASGILARNKLPFEILHPLILRTAQAVLSNKPEIIQTGPARRGDKKTLQAHLELLSEEPELQKIYKDLSTYILKKYGN